MKQKDLANKPVTKAELNVTLQEFRSSFKTELMAEVKELLTQFRSDMYTRFDEIINKFDQMREEQLFLRYDNKQLKEIDADHEKRLQKLETRIKH